MCLLIVSGCEPVADGGQNLALRETTSVDPRPLRHSEFSKIFGGKTFSVPTEKLEGNRDDSFRQSVTFLREDTNRAYRYYPNWTRGDPKRGKLSYYALGAVKKTQSSEPVVFRGKAYQKAPLFCFQDELSSNSHYCTTIFEANGQYFFGLAENDPILFSDGYHNLMTPLVKRAVADNNNTLLWALAGDFKRLEPDLVGKFRNANMRVWADNQNAIRAHNARVAADRARAEKEELARKDAEQRAYEKRRAAQEAKCRRETGKPCPGAGGGLVGAMLRGGISAAKSSSSVSSPSSFCGINDTCYRLVEQRRGGATVQCTKGIYASTERCIMVNKNGRWASGCGISDSGAHHYTFETAANKACGQ